MRTIPALLLTCCMAGCAALPEYWHSTAQQPSSPLSREVDALLDQPLIDPLTRFLEQHAHLHADDPDYQRIVHERNNRCQTIGTLYSQRTPSIDNLRAMRSGYQYSCPQQVAEFAQQVPEPRAPVANDQTAAPTLSPQASRCYLLFTIRNQQQALPVCTAAAEAGDARSQHHLASLLRSNQAITEALHWAEQSANSGYASGQLLLGELYQQGHGAPDDTGHALQLIEAAAEQGLAAAQYQAGIARLHGIGTEPDDAMALRWLERAAGQDDIPAQLQLAELYFSAPEPEQRRARQWLDRAATLGSATAQYRLGSSYLEGTGGGADPVEAYVWLSLALLNGEARAQADVTQLATRLSANQLDIARQRIADIQGRFN